MMNPQTLHETTITDIIDFIKNGVPEFDTDTPRAKRGIEAARSISKATSGLTLVFPTLISKNCSIENATMISKALERRNIALLQMAFSAYNITNSTDAIEHLQKFHTNIDSKVDLDTFIDVMDSLGESTLKYSSIIGSINEDCKRNINYTFADDFNPASLLEYKEVTRYGTTKVIKEAPLELNRPTRLQQRRNLINTGHRNNHDYDTPADSLDYTDQNKRWAADYDQRNDELRQSGVKIHQTMLTQQLMPTEVKKANELQPSLMIVNFYVNDKDRDLNIAQQVVAGVKSKLYPIDSEDILRKIITKNADGDLLLKLIRVSSREISFVKDFLLGIDNARLDSLQKSRRSSSSSMFKALERRAINGKIRSSLRMANTAKAIASLVITMEEVDELKKTQGIDVTSPRVILPIMEKLCLLNFIIVDTVSESIMILADGDTEYEQMSFDALEKDSGDSSYKKVINLMAKISR